MSDEKLRAAVADILSEAVEVEQLGALVGDGRRWVEKLREAVRPPAPVIEFFLTADDGSTVGVRGPALEVSWSRPPVEVPSDGMWKDFESGPVLEYAFQIRAEHAERYDVDRWVPYS